MYLHICVNYEMKYNVDNSVADIWNLNKNLFSSI